MIEFEVNRAHWFGWYADIYWNGHITASRWALTEKGARRQGIGPERPSMLNKALNDAN